MGFFLLAISETIHHDVVEPLLVHFFLAIALGHLISIYTTSDKKNIMYHIIIGGLIGIVQVAIMLLPARIGSEITIDISTVILAIAFGFFGRIAGFITLAVTLVMYIINMPPDFLLGIIPYLFAAIIPYFFRPLIVSPKRKTSVFVYFTILLYINSALIFLTKLPAPDFVENIWTLVITTFLLLPIVGLFVASLMYNGRLSIRKSQDIIARDRLQTAMINAPRDMEIFALDTDYNYLSFNEHHAHRFKKVLNGNAVIGKNFLNEINDLAARKRVEAALARGLSGETFDLEVAIEGQNGLYVHDFYNPIRDENGIVTGVTVFSYEISERKKHEQNITFYSYHDKLTGLYNRRYFDNYVESLQNLAEEVVVVYADISGLKIMNDMFGHDSGDELLKIVAKEISLAFSNEKSIVARTGGDEIIGLIRGASLKDVNKTITLVREKLLSIKVNDIEVSVSFNSSLAKSGKYIHAAQQHAEDLMYQDKVSGVYRHRTNIMNVILSKIRAFTNMMVHDEEVNDLTLAFGKKLNLTASELFNLQEVARLRVISNIVLANMDNLIYTTQFGPTDLFEIRKVLNIGYQILLTTNEYNVIATDIISLFENFDGSGLPRQIKKAEIPYKARIVRIVGDYVTLLHQLGADKKAEALNVLKQSVGKMYDPAIFAEFVKFI